MLNFNKPEPVQCPKTPALDNNPYKHPRTVSPNNYPCQEPSDSRWLAVLPKRSNLAGFGLQEKLHQPESLMSLAAKALNSNLACISKVSQDPEELDIYLERNAMYLGSEHLMASLITDELLPETYEIYSIGSHARKDALPRSERDLVVFNAAEQDKVEVAKQLSSAGHCFSFNPKIDFKTGSSLLLDSSLKNAFYPTQFLHNIAINQGNKKIEDLAEAIISGKQSDFNKKFYKGVVRSSFKKLVEVASKFSTVNFSSQEREFTAIKNELLRPIQNVMDQFIVRHLRDSGDTTECVEFLDKMPPSVVGQIGYLHNKGLIASIDIPEVLNLQNNYKIGVFYYHIAKLFDRCGVSLNMNEDMIGILLDSYKSTSRILSKLMG